MQRQLDDKTFVCGQITPDEVTAIKDLGVTMIVNNRPDNEDEGQPSSAEIEAATKAGGSGTKDLPNDNGVKVLVLVPASAEAQFRHTLTTFGAPATATSASGTSPDEPVNLEIVLANPH